MRSRSRNRRNAFNYFSATMLELFILGIFVIIAQPQLRQALYEIVEPSRPSSLIEQQRDPSLAHAAIPTPFSLAAAQSMPTLNLPEPAGQAMAYTTRYAPLEHYESLRIATAPNLEQAMPYVAAKPSFEPMSPSAATPLVASQWNIAAAQQSPRPLSGWAPAPPPDATYRDTYPPPYGTQSQWK